MHQWTAIFVSFVLLGDSAAVSLPQALVGYNPELISCLARLSGGVNQGTPRDQKGPRGQQGQVVYLLSIWLIQLWHGRCQDETYSESGMELSCCMLVTVNFQGASFWVCMFCFESVVNHCFLRTLWRRTRFFLTWKMSQASEVSHGGQLFQHLTSEWMCCCRVKIDAAHWLECLWKLLKAMKFSALKSQSLRHT